MTVSRVESAAIPDRLLSEGRLCQHQLVVCSLVEVRQWSSIGGDDLEIWVVVGHFSDNFQFENNLIPVVNCVADQEYFIMHAK